MQAEAQGWAMAVANRRQNGFPFTVDRFQYDDKSGLVQVQTQNALF